MKQKLAKLKKEKEIDKSSNIVSDFKSLLSVIDKKSKNKQDF